MPASTVTASPHGWFRYRVPVRSTGVELVVTEPQCLVTAVDILREEVDRTDHLANRFRPSSEISRVNACAAGRCG